MNSLLRDIQNTIEKIDLCKYEPSPDLVRILVLAEDRRFYFHLGVDPISIVRAICRTCFQNKLEGASTIPAQLFRTVSARKEVTLKRKFRELFGSVIISIARGKHEIAKCYLDAAHFGFDDKGIRHAAQKLKYDIHNLREIEKLDLVARIKRPSHKPLRLRKSRALVNRIRWLGERAGLGDEVIATDLLGAEPPEFSRLTP